MPAQRPPRKPRRVAMSRGPGTPHRRILDRLRARGWAWLSEFSRGRADRASYWRAACRLQARGQLRIEFRDRWRPLRQWVRLVSANHSPSAIPVNESCSESRR